MRTTRLFLLTMAVACLTVGCEDDPTITNRSDDPEGPAPYAEATTPDQLVANLVRAYNERHYLEYEKLLHADFLFYLSHEDVAAGADALYSRARDLEATYRMFHGEPGNAPSGDEQPPIRSISLRLTPEAGGWTDQVAQDFQGTLMRRYEVDMTIEYAGGIPTAVTGLQEFYAFAVEHDDGEGGMSTIYQLRFWRDLGKEGLKTDSSSWSSIKWAFGG